MPPMVAGMLFFLTPVYFLTALSSSARLNAERFALAGGADPRTAVPHERDAARPGLVGTARRHARLSRPPHPARGGRDADLRQLRQRLVALPLHPPRRHPADGNLALARRDRRRPAARGGRGAGLGEGGGDRACRRRRQPAHPVPDRRARRDAGLRSASPPRRSAGSPSMSRGNRCSPASWWRKRCSSPAGSGPADGP